MVLPGRVSLESTGREERGRPGRLRKVLTTLLLLTAACGQADGGGSAATTSEPTATLARGENDDALRVLAMELSDDGSGWVATEEGIRRREAGEWHDRTPPGWGRARANRWRPGFAFDGSSAWMAWSTPNDGEDRPRAQVFRTTDGGRTWFEASLDEPSEFEGRNMRQPELFFLTEQTGWLMVPVGSGLEAPVGILYRTTDAGATWERVLGDAPTTGSFRFATPRRGWMTGGPSGGDLYSTTDGGRSWTKEDVPERSPDQPSLTTVAAPRFFGSDRGVLPVQARRPDESGSDLHFFNTSDRGATWTRAGPPVITLRTDDVFFGRRPTFSPVSASIWFMDAAELWKTTDGGGSWQQVETSEGYRRVVDLDFATSDAGWAYSILDHRLLETDDGGRTWTRTALD